MQPVLSMANIKKAFPVGDELFWALKGVNFDIYEGEFVALLGPSGSGKTTLMQILGILDKQTEGHYILRGKDVTDLNEAQRARVRNQDIGFVFQAFHLLPRLNILENVEVPMQYAGFSPRARRDHAMQVLDQVGLADKWRNLPSQISGGQKQRVAIARALVMNPALLLTDEPTGNLDTKTGNEIMALFRGLNDSGVTIVIVTHEPTIASQTKRNIFLRDGFIERDEIHKQMRTEVTGHVSTQSLGYI